MSWVTTGLFALAALYGNAANSNAPSQSTVYAGTYVIRICKGLCTQSTSASNVTGVLVLFDKPVRNSLGHVFRAELDREPVNGCFVLKSAGVPSGSLAEIAPEGFFSWALFPPDNTVDFQLYRSPDGGYGLSLGLVANGLSGTGRIWGGAVGRVSVHGPYSPTDSLVADRVGEPDIKQCPLLP